jgi:hypothetical protein
MLVSGQSALLPEPIHICRRDDFFNAAVDI